MKIIDNLIALRILTLLTTPFNQTDAYKLGIIDDEGKVLRKYNTLQTSDEKDSVNYLKRLVFNLKRMMNLIPGGDNRIKNLAAAMFLIKESYENENDENLISEQFINLVTSNKRLLDEELHVIEFLPLLENANGRADC
jgi:hypothetical protein